MSISLAITVLVSSILIGFLIPSEELREIIGRIGIQAAFIIILIVIFR